jgi:hypothetical protein
LRYEINDYRNNYYKLYNSTSSRISFVKRIKRTFLTQNNQLYVEWPEASTEPSKQEIIENIIMAGDSPTIAIFDDLAYLAMQVLEQIYFGKVQIKTTIALASLNQDNQGFKKSAFCQSMKNDLGGTAYLTVDQYIKAIDRLQGCYASQLMDLSKLDMVLNLFDEITFDYDYNKILGKKKHKSQMNLTDDMSPQIKSILKNASPVRPIQGWNDQITHAFLPLADPKQFCEYCFKPGKAKPNEESDLYSCESII